MDLNTHLISPNTVLRQAAADSAPHLVWLNEGRIRATPRPEGTGAIQSTLASTPMAGRPLVFTAYLLAMTSLSFQFWSLSRSKKHTKPLTREGGGFCMDAS